MVNCARKYSLLVFALLFMASCSEYTKVQKSHDSELKYATARKYFDQKNYGKALTLLNDVEPFFRGRDKAEYITYYMAYSHYYEKDFYMAAHYFKNYTRLYPSGKLAEECYYMSAYSLFLDSPYYKLDQTSAIDAMKEMQLFINYYPRSSRIEEANRIIDQLREKLAHKDFEIARLYYKRDMYSASAIAFANVAKDFPETKYREEALFMVVKSYYYYANHSIASKQGERYEKVLEAFEKFERSYPDSPFLEDAQKFRKNSLKKLNLEQNS